MSHEIRTPMAAILGYVDLIAEPDVTRAQLHEFTTTIQRNAKHLLELINQVLDLSKIEARQMRVERIVCAPAAISREIVSFMRPRAQEKNLGLTLRFVGQMPDTIHSDPLRLRQILLNLMGNAIKFTQVGDVELAVSLEDVAPPLLKFQVRDTGIGIEQSQLANLFHPFSQADSSTTRRFGGTGLGLSIANHLAGLLGGRIDVDSCPGQGSTFSMYVETGDLTGVTLTECSSEVENSPVTSIVAPPWPLAAPLAGLRILLVEDGLDNQRLITLHLSRAGANVEVLENGHLAVERLTTPAAPEFDAVLMDMQMPVLDGYAATAKLRALGYSGTIIALTAHAMEGDEQKCLNAGCTDYATKPIDSKRIVALILEHMMRADLLYASAVSSPKPARLIIGEPQAAVVSHDPKAAGGGSEAQTRPPMLSTFQDDPDMIELIEMFVDSLVERVSALEAASRERDDTKLATLVHQLKGAGGGYGFGPISTTAQKLEADIAKHVDRKLIEAGVAELIAVCRSARTGRELQDAPAASVTRAGTGVR
jgi:CheY-like chemotaxis protein/HPt (histidine-containing phosphotransfer) domain-containing protein